MHTDRRNRGIVLGRETILPCYDDDDSDDSDDDKSAMRKDSCETRDATACERKEIHRNITNELAQPVMTIKRNDIASLIDGYQGKKPLSKFQ